MSGEAAARDVEVRDPGEGGGHEAGGDGGEVIVPDIKLLHLHHPTQQGLGLGPRELGGVEVDAMELVYNSGEDGWEDCRQSEVAQIDVLQPELLRLVEDGEEADEAVLAEVGPRQVDLGQSGDCPGQELWSNSRQVHTAEVQPGQGEPLAGGQSSQQAGQLGQAQASELEADLLQSKEDGSEEGGWQGEQVEGGEVEAPQSPVSPGEDQLEHLSQV